MSFQLKVVLATAVLLMAAGAAIFLSGSSEDGRVEHLIRQGFEDAGRHDAERCIGYLSPEFKTSSMDYQETCEWVRQTLGGKLYDTLELHEVDVSVFGDTATARVAFDVRSISSVRVSRKVALHLVKKETGWKIASAEETPR